MRFLIGPIAHYRSECFLADRCKDSVNIGLQFFQRAWYWISETVVCHMSPQECVEGCKIWWIGWVRIWSIPRNECGWKMILKICQISFSSVSRSTVLLEYLGSIVQMIQMTEELQVSNETIIHDRTCTLLSWHSRTCNHFPQTNSVAVRYWKCQESEGVTDISFWVWEEYAKSASQPIWKH